MSSDLKDARWQLAEQMCEMVGINFFDLEYIDKQKVLDSASCILSMAGDWKIRELAKTFRGLE